MSLRRRKGMALLAYLLVTNQPHNRDSLATMLWPESDQSTARANLRRDLSRLQNDIGEGLLAVEREQIACAPEAALWVDVTVFENHLAFVDEHNHELGNLCAQCRKLLHDAIELYTDDFMAGFSLPDCPEFDEWQYFQTERLRRIFASALQKLSLEYAVRGNYKEAITLAQRWLALDPLHEPAQRQLMSIYAWAEQWGAALKQYRDAVDILQNELGVAPDAETTALYEAIRKRQAPPLPKGTNQHTNVDTANGKEGESRQHTLPFVGRDQEYEQLCAALREAQQGQGCVVFVEGEPGVGKSRLVAEVMRKAQEQGLRVLSGKCYQGEQAMPYQVIIDLLDQVLVGWPDVVAELAGPSLAELTLLAPELSDRFPQHPPPSAALEEARRARLFRALYQLLRRLAATHGFMLVVDDLHWADQVTRLFFNQLSHQIGNEHILLVQTCRTEDIATDENLAEYVQTVLQKPNTVHITLKRLAPEDTQMLLAQLPLTAAQPPQLAQWLHQESDGNPFYLETILQTLQELGVLEEVGAGHWQPDIQELQRAYSGLTLPDALKNCVRSRLHHVPHSERTLLDVAAVFGRRFDFNTLQTVTSEEGFALLDRLEDLLRRQLLREEEDGRFYDFSHDKIREVVYQDLSNARRQLLHRQIGTALEGDAPESVRELPALLASHFEQGQLWEQALRHLITAAARARELFAIGEAIAFYDRALQLAQQHLPSEDESTLVDLYEARGDVRALAGDFEGAVDDLQAALEYLSVAHDKVRERTLLTQLGMIYRRADDYSNAKQPLNRALTLGRQENDAHSVADTLFHLGTVIWSEGDNSQAIPYHKEAVELCEAHQFNDLVAVQAYHGRGETFFMAGKFEEARLSFERSLALARKRGDKSYEAENLYMLGGLYSGLIGADYPAAQRYLEESLRISRVAQMDWHIVAPLFMLGHVLGSRGNYYEGLQKAREAVQLAERLSIVYFKSIAHDFLGVLYRHLNLLEQAEAIHAQGVEEARAVNAGNWQPRIEANLAIDRLRRGDLSVGPTLRSALETTLRRAQQLHAAPCLEGLAELALARGELNEAIKYADQLLSLAQPRGMWEKVTRAHYWHGVALLAKNELDAAAVTLSTAQIQARKLGTPRLLWRIEEAMAQLRQHQGLDEDAAEHERNAREIVNQIAHNLPDVDLRVCLPLNSV